MDSASQESAPEATTPSDAQARRLAGLAKARATKASMAQKKAVNAVSGRVPGLGVAVVTGSPIMGGHGGTYPVVQVSGKPVSTVPVNGIRITERVIHVQGQRVQQVIGRTRTSIVTISAR